MKKILIILIVILISSFIFAGFVTDPTTVSEEEYAATASSAAGAIPQVDGALNGFTFEDDMAGEAEVILPVGAQCTEPITALQNQVDEKKKWWEVLSEIRLSSNDCSEAYEKAVKFFKEDVIGQETDQAKLVSMQQTLAEFKKDLENVPGTGVVSPVPILPGGTSVQTKETVVKWLKISNANFLNGNYVKRSVVLFDEDDKKVPAKPFEQSIAGLKNYSENVGVVKFGGKNVFVAELKPGTSGIFLDQKFWIDLSDLDVEYPPAGGLITASGKSKHDIYFFKLAVLTPDEGVPRFLHFNVFTDKRKTLDCSGLTDSGTWDRIWGSVVQKVSNQNFGKTFLEFIGVSIGAKMGAPIIRVSGKLVGAASLKTFGKVISKAAGPVALVSGVALYASKAAGGPDSKLGEAFFTDKMIIDLFADADRTFNCVNESAPKANIPLRPGYELKVQIVGFEPPLEEGKNAKLYFVIQPLKEMGDSRASSEYYAVLPNQN